LERIERDSRPIEEKERNKIVLEKEIELLDKKTKIIENTRAKISTDIIDELLDILETIFDVAEASTYKREVAFLEARLTTKVDETKDEIKTLHIKIDNDDIGNSDDDDDDDDDADAHRHKLTNVSIMKKNLDTNKKKIEDYTTRMKSVDKLKKELEAIEGKNNKLVVGSFSQNPYPRDSLMYVRYEIKTKESEKKKVEEQLTELKYKQKREELKLENYTLRVYVYELKGVSLVSKYLSNGKKNQQFALLQSKGYGVRGTSEYQKNADKLMKDAPMFSAASCLQQKTEIQNMFDNIVLSTREKIKDALDNQQQVGGAGNGEGAGAAESLQPASTKERIIQNYKEFSISELLLGPEKPYVSKQPPSKKCTGSIRERGDDTESKLLQSVNIKMGSYPPFLIPQTFYKMHKVSYYPPIKDDVELNCVPQPPSKCVAGVYNLDMLLYPSDIQVAFPNINTTEESIKYKETIQKQHKFENTGMIVAGPPEEI